MSSQWCELGASSIKDGVLFVRCTGGAVDEDGSAPDYGDVPAMCSLGVTAVPYPPTKEGAAEGLIDRDAPGLDGVMVAGRDTRTAKAIGNPKPGTTVLHSTGPQQAAQVQCIEDKRQVAQVTKNAAGKTLMALLDGDGDGKYQVAVGGALIQIDGSSGDISIVNKAGAGILIQGGNVHFIGNPVLGAGNPPLCFMLGPPTGSPGGIASVPLFPCQGVTPGS